MRREFVTVALLILFTSGAVLSGTVFADPASGKALFKGRAKCKNCHKITSKKKVGPGLAGVMSRASDEWIKAWLKNPRSVWTANEGYTQTLKKTMKKEKKQKPTHKTRKLTDGEISDLLDYLKTL